MSFRFQKFTTIYPNFLSEFLSENPDCQDLSYQELYDRFINTWYGLGNYYAKHLQALGHEAQDLFADLEPLQKAWAREHGVHYGQNTWLRDIVLAQVRHFQPDVLYLQDLYLFDADFRQQLREACNRPTLLLGWRAAHTTNYASFRDLDLVFTAVPNFERAFRQHGVNAMCMPLAFEHTALEAVKLPAERDMDLTFVGSLGSSTGVHAQRYVLLEYLMTHAPLQVWGETSTPSAPLRRAAYEAVYQANCVLSKLGVSKSQRQSLPLIGRGANWMRDPLSPPFLEWYPDRCHPPVFGLQNLEILARSKIAFNCHTDIAENYAGNIRLYEATGMGACLLTDWKDNLPDLFEPEVEVVTYRNVEECVEKVFYLLEHPAECQAIAAAGQRRTLRDHTYLCRVQHLVKVIDHLLNASRTSQHRPFATSQGMAAPSR